MEERKSKGTEGIKGYDFKELAKMFNNELVEIDGQQYWVSSYTYNEEW